MTPEEFQTEADKHLVAQAAIDSNFGLSEWELAVQQHNLSIFFSSLTEKLAAGLMQQDPGPVFQAYAMLVQASGKCGGFKTSRPHSEIVAAREIFVRVVEHHVCKTEQHSLTSEYLAAIAMALGWAANLQGWDVDEFERVLGSCGDIVTSRPGIKPRDIIQ